MGYSIISPAGDTIRSESLSHLSEITGVPYGDLANLSCGYRFTHKGWCSTHRKAKVRRKRFLLELVNSRTGERVILGQSVTAFARNRGLSPGRLQRLVVGRRVGYKDWVLGKTFDLINSRGPAGNF